MILEHASPVCEFDTDRDALIRPGDFLSKTLPPKCVITFFRTELEQLVRQRGLRPIGQLHAEVLDLTVYGDGGDVCVTMPFSTAPGAACTIEELHAMGCSRFLVCGGAGALRENSRAGEIFVPTAALRDEGTSYHYLPPARTVECHPGALADLCAGLDRLGISYTPGLTWTTDALYRETPALVRRRREEG